MFWGYDPFSKSSYTTNCSPLKMVVSKSGISFCTGLYFINGRTAGFREGNRCIVPIRMAKKELERSIKIARDSYDTYILHDISAFYGIMEQ